MKLSKQNWAMVVLSSATALLISGACATPPGKNTRSVASDELPASGLVRSDYAVGEVTRLCKAAMDATTVRLDALAKLPAAQRTYGNTLLAFESAMADLSDLTSPLTFMGYVSTHEKVHDEGSACEEEIGKFGVGVMSRKDVYYAFKDAVGETPAEKRLLSETLRGFLLSGMNLSNEKLAEVKELKTQLASLEAQFSANLNKDVSAVEFDASELEGVSADFLARLKKSSTGKFIVTTKEADYTQLTQTAKSGGTRRKMLMAYYNRAADKNVKLLENAIQLREQIAAVMGFTTWADYRTQGRMAKDSLTILKFLDGLKNKLAERNRADLNKLLAYKKTSDPTAKNLKDVKIWDIGYLSYQLKKRDYSLDEEKVREYFPADLVIQGMFEIYAKLLSVRYIEVTDAHAWSPDVKMYRIEDARKGQQGRLIGYFYTDFFPRAGKYGHAAAFPIISGRLLPDGSYSKPVSAIVANLTPPGNGKPSLLSHDDVVTIFHEFGHINHQTLTRAPYASLSGSAVAQDFVEAPSQMLENWPWRSEALSKLSGFYLDPSQKLPEELLKKLVDSRDFNQGYFYTRQLMLALLDMTYHTAEGPVDSTAEGDRLYKEIIGVDPIEGGHFQASFGHLMGGYDAGYYGYLWSEVYAADMFTRFEVGGLLNPEVGDRYRRDILERGNMSEALDLLRDFLGREPNNEAFFKKLHI